MFDSKEYGYLLEILGGTKYGTGQGPAGEVFGTTLGAAYMWKLGVNEGEVLVLSGVFFEVSGILGCYPLGMP